MVWVVHSHRLGNGHPHLFRRLDKMPIGKVGVARRGPVPPMPEQLADQRQILARHHGVAGCRVPKVVQAKPAELRVFAYRPPARCEVIRAPTFGVARE